MLRMNKMGQSLEQIINIQKQRILGSFEVINGNLTPQEYADIYRISELTAREYIRSARQHVAREYILEAQQEK